MEEIELLGRVRERLLTAGDVQEKRMFGSIAFMVNGTLRLAVGEKEDRVMMVRVDPEEYDEALAREGAAPAVMKARSMRNYLFLSDAAVVEDVDLQWWVDLALRSPDSTN
ncbi:TfoX/Sxy family protein [Branchiibius sp. NY16-3462-2]|uniref:TfoX/Sxy family protein n=1 Tax=Branchiibius sp. NY16-3462-2 TaxID=1807500 RepID=UPI000792CBA8|nr:TfoX/Sxy family protein [Branchiibius sp. NY16-3462-2]KYH44734.1 hypothetical protein AZH51_03665 [Branchiibius sp. NY16-3462-2]